MITSRTLSTPRVRGGVDLEHVDVAALGNLAAGVAFAARIGRRALHAVQRARQNARGGGLADAARPGKHERLRDPPARDRVPQRARHRRLADDVVELLRAPLAGENLVRTLRVGMLVSGLVRMSLEARRACGTAQGLLSAAAFRP